MNSNKTGLFISKLRREQGITQKELADRIGVSDKTVSKWETGRSIPDMLYLESLCTALDVTMNELISGERLSKEAYSEKAEENLAQLIGESETGRKRDVIASAVGGALFAIAIFILMLTGFGEDRMLKGFLSYLDLPTLITLALLSMGCVLISGKKQMHEVISLLRRISLPSGGLITLITFILIFENWDFSEGLGLNIAVSLLGLIYSFIEYIIVVLIEERKYYD